MNRTKRLAGRVGWVMYSALLGALTGCVHEHRRPPTVYVPAPRVEASVTVSLPGVEVRTESDFYEPLTPYGRWEVVGSHGRCWIPRGVEADWRPYSDGYWQRTDAGWYWASSEPWAWATYHYGRWDVSAQFGWFWVPRTQWAPAWVSWHRGGGYIGWAPLYPSARFAAGGSVEVDVRVISPRAYVFVEEGHFMAPVRRSAVVVNNTTIINRTVNITNVRVVNNTVINEGPATAVIEQAGGRRLQAVPVHELRRRDEAPVVSRRRQPISATADPLRPTAPKEAGPGRKNAVAAPASPQVETSSTARRESARPAPRSHEAQQVRPRSFIAAKEPKPVVAPAVRSEFGPARRHSSTVTEPTQERAEKRFEKQAEPVKPSARKMPRPAKAKPDASKKKKANATGKRQENKVNE